MYKIIATVWDCHLEGRNVWVYDIYKQGVYLTACLTQKDAETYIKQLEDKDEYQHA